MHGLGFRNALVRSTLLPGPYLMHTRGELKTQSKRSLTSDRLVGTRGENIGQFARYPKWPVFSNLANLPRFWLRSSPPSIKIECTLNITRTVTKQTYLRPHCHHRDIDEAYVRMQMSMEFLLDH